MLVKINFLMIISMFISVGCTQMSGHRDYLSEMQQEDSSFYQPSEDFPVVAGDTGRMSESRVERRSRTPASDSEFSREQDQYFLIKELATLEANQSEGAFDFYSKYKNKLTTTSEKIYFLKLPLGERRDYLVWRGFLRPATNSLSTDRGIVQKQNQVFLGMSKEEVMNTIGAPKQVEVAGNPSHENERWLYNHNGASSYVYFESGRVEGWE
jgi:hypothetical protein